MGIKKRDWQEVADYISKIESAGMSYKEGAKHYGIKLSDISEYNKRFKKSKFDRGPGKVRNWDKIAEYVSRIESLGMSYAAGADHFGISVSSIYKYNSQIKRKNQQDMSSQELSAGSPGTGSRLTTEEENPSKEPSSAESGLEEVVESGKRSVRKCSGKSNVDLPPGVAEMIINYRRQYPDHGFKRIGDYLKHQYFVVVPRKKIRELLKFHDLTGSSDSSFDQSSLAREKKGTRRFEASYPRELYQMDITNVYLVNQAIYYLVVVVDDYSRFCISCELRRDYLTISMIDVLHRAIERYGKPTKLLTDQGSSFYSWSPEPTIFSRYLDDMKIEHIVAEPHSPQTLGKVERLHQTIQRELLNKSHFVTYEEARQRIENYIHQYNYERPHQGIGGACPASRFHGVIGETSRIESQLLDKGIDFSRGYLVFKMFEHTISIVCNGNGLQVFLDGYLLKYDPENRRPA